MFSHLSCRVASILGLITCVTGCVGDETLTNYGASGQVWELQGMNGAVLAAPVRLVFEKRGAVIGNGLCNRFEATQSAPYPWFTLSDYQQSNLPCGAEEAQVFAAIKAMTLVEISGDLLILSDDVGQEMTFRAALKAP